jgi:hypothetical protein
VLAPQVAPLTGMLAGLGAVLLLAVLVRGHEDVLGPALLALGAAYLLGLLAGRHVLDEAAPVAATLLLLCGELATWSLEQRRRLHVPRPLRLARAGAVAALAVGGLAASTLVLVVSEVPFGSGLAWTVVGGAAAVAAIGIAARLSAR